jgi:zeaxanthin glucosyltransferase
VSRIALLIEHEEGHLNPTFRLARRLAVRGHEIVYLGLADGEGAVRAQGFDFVPILEDLFPRGTLQTLREAARSPSGAAGIMAAAQHVGSGSAYAKTWQGLICAGDSLDAAIHAARPDLFLLTSSFAPHALVLRNRYDTPAVLLTTLLRVVPKSDYAVKIRGLLRDGGEATRRFVALMQSRNPSLGTADIAARVLAQVLKMRELILCPGDLELPGRLYDGEPEVYYVEPTVDFERRGDGVFPWDRLDPRRRLLYVSLGSQSYQTGRERAVRFFGAVAAAFYNRPDWQLVLSTGGLMDHAEIPQPPGAVAAAWVPQLAILDRASVMITHGGLGTVKECIVRGVPMVVFPSMHDQPENARRIVHHRLGTAGDLGEATAGGVLSLVEEADGPAVRQSLAGMQRRFLEAEDAGRAVRLIEEVLARSGTPASQGGSRCPESPS